LLSDGAGNPEEAFRSMRSAGLDVAAVTDHARMGRALWRIPSAGDTEALSSLVGLTRRSWEEVGLAADRANVEGTFVAIRGFEWSSPSIGHMNVWCSREWTDPMATGALSRADAAVPWAPDTLRRLHPSARGFVDRLAGSAPACRPSIRSFQRWLGSSPRRDPGGGGLDGFASFNHPGRDGCTFDDFAFDPSIAPRVVGIEAFNRDEDYLFEGADLGRPSPLNACLNAGWRAGMLGVSDEHGGRWGLGTSLGRTGMWARRLTRSGIREALQARRFFATTAPGLLLDMLGNGHRMGSVVPVQRDALRLEIDLDVGPGWAGGRPLLQVLGPGESIPEVLACVEAVPRQADPLTIEVPVDGRGWIMVRVSDPEAPADPRAPAPFDGFGRAVAYGSPFFLRRS
jgi:hypothetical protein